MNLKGFTVIIIELAKRYFKNGVSNTAAALSYYLIFSFFPTIVFISSLLGYADINTEVVVYSLSGFMPKEIIDLIINYLVYLKANTSSNILMVSLFFTIYFPVRAMSRVMDGINKAYNIKSKRKIFQKILMMVSFAVVLGISIIIILLLLLLGRTVIDFAIEHLKISLPNNFVDVWMIIRFMVIGIIGFIALILIYIFVPECKVRADDAVYGATFSGVSWLLISMGFSYYVENSDRYTVLYGSLGAIIVLLIWLFMISAVLLTGAELNSLLMDKKQNKAK